MSPGAPGQVTIAPHSMSPGAPGQVTIARTAQHVARGARSGHHRTAQHVARGRPVRSPSLAPRSMSPRGAPVRSPSRTDTAAPVVVHHYLFVTYPLFINQYSLSTYWSSNAIRSFLSLMWAFEYLWKQ